MIQKPKPTAGLHHVALYIQNFDACEYFYTEILGMKIDWRPDPDNVYLTSGNDNLALHRTSKELRPDQSQRLDHIGFFLKAKEDVDVWFQYMQSQDVTIKVKPKDHRDGSRSFYCADPDGNVVQMIYYPRG